jgi:hypothetical protein
MDKIDKIEHIFQVILREMRKKVKKLIENDKSADEIAYHAFLISQIITKRKLSMPTEAELLELLAFANTIPITKKQYPLIILLTNLSVFPR